METQKEYTEREYSEYEYAETEYAQCSENECDYQIYSISINKKMKINFSKTGKSCELNIMQDFPFSNESEYEFSVTNTNFLR